MRFETFESEAEVAAAAAELLAAAVRAKPDARVILPAGKTPLLLYAEILRRATAHELDLSRARFVQLDEYVGCGPKEPRSFRSLLSRHLLDPLEALGRSADQDRLIDGAAKDVRAEIERHGARFLQEGGADLCFLGLGRNGHVAFNEPGTPREQRAHEVPLASQTRAAAEPDFGRSKAPERGITLGLHEIRASRRIVLLVTGASKRAILAALFDEPPSSARPASLLLDQPDLVILADRAATRDP
jgi:6-phosphogluconolactonase/glucosamine-6-phosphate isomerase/deaminase